MTKPIVNIGMEIVVAGAQQYLNAHNMQAEPEALFECCKRWLKIQLPIAIRDAKEAMACGMTQVAEETFKATLILAGVEAAKEAAQRNCARVHPEPPKELGKSGMKNYWVRNPTAKNRAAPVGSFLVEGVANEVFAVIEAEKVWKAAGYSFHPEMTVAVAVAEEPDFSVLMSAMLARSKER